jgi:hypothetical protein
MVSPLNLSKANWVALWVAFKAVHTFPGIVPYH